MIMIEEVWVLQIRKSREESDIQPLKFVINAEKFVCSIGNMTTVEFVEAAFLAKRST
jgi:hypothetical protein